MRFAFLSGWDRGNITVQRSASVYIRLAHTTRSFDCFIQLINYRHVLRLVAAPAKVSIVHLTFDPLCICLPAENGSQNVWDK